jgi:hypothetical protein
MRLAKVSLVNSAPPGSFITCFEDRSHGDRRIRRYIGRTAMTLPYPLPPAINDASPAGGAAAVNADEEGFGHGCFGLTEVQACPRWSRPKPILRLNQVQTGGDLELKTVAPRIFNTTGCTEINLECRREELFSCEVESQHLLQKST